MAVVTSALIRFGEADVPPVRALTVTSCNEMCADVFTAQGVTTGACVNLSDGVESVESCRNARQLGGVATCASFANDTKNVALCITPVVSAYTWNFRFTANPELLAVAHAQSRAPQVITLDAASVTSIQDFVVPTNARQLVLQPADPSEQLEIALSASVIQRWQNLETLAIQNIDLSGVGNMTAFPELTTLYAACQFASVQPSDLKPLEQPVDSVPSRYSLHELPDGLVAGKHIYERYPSDRAQLDRHVDVIPVKKLIPEYRCNKSPTEHHRAAAGSKWLGHIANEFAIADTAQSSISVAQHNSSRAAVFFAEGARGVVPAEQLADGISNRDLQLDETVHIFFCVVIRDLRGNEIRNLSFTQDQVTFLSTQLQTLAIDAAAFSSNCQDKVLLRGTYSICLQDSIGDNDNDDVPTSSEGNDASNTKLVTALIIFAVVLVVASFVGGRKYAQRHHRRFDDGLNASRHGATLDSTDDDSLQQWRINAEDLLPIKRLATRPYGTVWLASFYSETVLVKRINQKRISANAQLDFIRKITVLGKLEHPNIIRLIGVAWTTEVDVQMALEYMSTGNLRRYLTLTKDDPVAREWNSRKLSMALNVAHALVYLHSRCPQVLHRDLRSRSVLLDAELTAKVSGFGLRHYKSDIRTTNSRMTSTPMRASSVNNSNRCIAPEVLAGESDYTDAADMYAFGIILSELDTHELPFSDVKLSNGNPLDEQSMLELLTAGALQPTISAQCPPEVATLILDCLSLLPEHRPTAVGVVDRLQSTMDHLLRLSEVGEDLLSSQERMDSFLGVDTRSNRQKSSSKYSFRQLNFSSEKLEPQRHLLNTSGGRLRHVQARSTLSNLSMFSSMAARDPSSEDDFLYRTMSDVEEPPQYLRRRGSTTTSFVADVTPTMTPSAIASAEPQISATLDETSDATLFPPPPPTKGIPTTMKVLSNSSSEDWAAEEQTRQDVKATRTSGADLFRRKSAHPMVVHHQQQEHRIGIQDNDKGSRHPVVSSAQERKVLWPTQPSASLHGKDLRRFLSIGSIEPIARHSNSVDWSDTIASEMEEMDHMSLMDPYYDLTRSKLTKLFSLFHPDADGMVNYDGFRRGMEAMGIVCADDDEFDIFIDKVDEDHSGGISFDEFQHTIQEIKLAQLFSENFIHEMGLEPSPNVPPAIVGAIEYSPDRIRSVYPVQNIEKFIYSKKPAWATVRWINVEICDPLIVRRLSVRYCLHPLAVEDALDIDRERPKYEKYEEHSSLILQTVHAVDLNKLKTYQRMYRASLYTKDDMSSVFDKMDKKELTERLKDLQIGRVMTKPEQLSVYMLKDVLISVQETTSTLWPIVKSRLDTSYSKVRQHSTPFLVYTIVDSCVDELTPIVHTFGAKLVMLDRLVHLDPRSFDVIQLQNSAKQIKGLKRLCRPLNEVIVQLCESNDFTGEILRYFRDVQDHIAIVDEDCDKHLDTCKSLTEELHNIRAVQQSDVSYILALVAAIFLPAQFLTGLYGMNFENMPELRYHNGYYLWWMAVIIIALLTFSFFRFYKKWI
ncbi:Cora metal ion transporter, partial [Globisporangium splendens]